MSKEAYRVYRPSTTCGATSRRDHLVLDDSDGGQGIGPIIFMNMYFCWHYAIFTALAKGPFYRDFLTGKSSQYCSPLLVRVMLALGCHFSARGEARADFGDSATTGDHFFAEAKRLLYEDDEFTNAKLYTVQALALMSVREVGCGLESKAWVYSGMSSRMACDLGLNVDAAPINESSRLADGDIDARRITFWGCFLFDKYVMIVAQLCCG